MSRTTLLAIAVALLASLCSLTACGLVTKQAGFAPSASGPGFSPPTLSVPATQPVEPSDPASAAGRVASGIGVPRLPASVWLPSRSVPLYPAYHWGSLAAAAKAVPNPELEFERLCNSTRDPSNDLSDWHGPAGQASVHTTNHRDWQVTQTVIHFPGDTSTAVQTAYTLFQGLQNELTGCVKSAPGAKVTTTASDVTTRSGDRDVATTLTIPESGGGAWTVHEYLTVTDSAVVELALFADQPSHPYTDTSDQAVLRALEAPLCPAFNDC